MVTGTVEIMISTMHRSDANWLQNMNIRSDAVVVNQGDTTGEKSFLSDGHRILWWDSAERGLSKSRNTAISAASADYVMLADDDMEYLDDYPETVRQAFGRYPDADILAFRVEGIEEPFKTYSSNPKKLNYLTSLHLCSVELAFRRRSVTDRNLRFNEQFGSGATYRMGEENIFLFDCLRAGLSIQYVPQTIARLHIGDSTWFDGYNQRYFRDLGAAYREMFGAVMGRLMLFLFAVRKRSLYRGSLSFGQVLCSMKRGFCEYACQQKDGKKGEIPCSNR